MSDNCLAAESILLGRTSLVIGDVQFKDPATEEDFHPLVMGQEIKTGFLLKVPENGRAEVCYLDGAIIRFKSGSKVQFQLTSLRLFTGKVWCRVIKHGQKFEVVTPTFVAGVRGTVFAVEAGRKDQGEVAVYEGTVYSKTNMANVDVTAGNGIKVSPTGEMTPPAKLETLIDADFSEDKWQAYDRKSAYKRYMMLLFKGIDPVDLESGKAEAELVTRKKLPEVQHADWTYKTYQNEN
jgi:hypothetical protein